MRSDPWLIVGLILAILLGAYNTIMEWRAENPPKDEVSLMFPWVAIVFATHWQRSARRPEAGGGGSKTEQAGYIPPQVQIERLILAGQRLQQARKEEFDFPQDQPDDPSWVDMTRMPGFDLADASQAMLALQAKRQAASETVKARKAFSAALGGRALTELTDEELTALEATPKLWKSDLEKIAQEKKRRLDGKIEPRQPA